MSQSLARLRELFGDPLLVRKGRSMVLTPRAEAMLLPLSDALLSVERALQLGMGFDAATSTRIFKIALTDLSVTMVLPSVLRLIGERAPGIRVQAEPLSSGRLPSQCVRPVPIRLPQLCRRAAHRDAPLRRLCLPRAPRPRSRPTQASPYRRLPSARPRRVHPGGLRATSHVRSSARSCLGRRNSSIGPLPPRPPGRRPTHRSRCDRPASPAIGPDRSRRSGHARSTQ